MFTDEEIQEIKDAIPDSISYPMIAQATNGQVSLSEVKRFYAYKTVPFTKALEIVKSTKKLIREQESKKKKALSL